MKLSFATLGCPDWTMDQIAAQAGALGFDGVELRGVAGEHIGPEEPPADRERIRTLFREHRVEIACISGYTRLTPADPGVRSDERRHLEKLIGVARDVGCPMIRIFGGAWEGSDRDANVRRAVETVQPLVDFADRHGVRLALENHDAWCRGADLAAILSRVDSPALGICWDVVNSVFIEPPETTFAAIRDRIIHVHFKDAARQGESVHSVLPGTGQVDLHTAYRLLRENGYAGYFSFEWEKKWEPGLDGPEIAFPHYVRYMRHVIRPGG